MKKGEAAAIPLFSGIAPQELEPLLECLGVVRRNCSPGDSIFLQGDSPGSIGVVLTGQVQVVREEINGARTIVAQLEPGDLFGEVFAFLPEKEPLPVSVFCVQEGQILLLPGEALRSPCAASCGFHRTLVGNMLGILARRTLLLNRRLEILSKRSTREKLLAYLWGEAKLDGGGEFTIPFDRQELADYLCVERSAMSAALGRLRDEGVLEFHKNRFRLLKMPGLG